MSNNISVPFRDLLNPRTASAHITVPGRMLEMDFGAISTIGADGSNYVIPAIKGFKIGEEMDVPIDDFGTYLFSILVPNTFIRTARYIAGGLLKGISWLATGKTDKLDNYIKEVSDPVFESFTKEVILGGAGLTLEQLKEYTGFEPIKQGAGGSYPKIKIDELKGLHGRQYGRVVGLKSGDRSPDDLLKESFGRDYSTVVSNDEFMAGFDVGVNEGIGYRNKRIDKIRYV